MEMNQIAMLIVSVIAILFIVAFAIQDNKNKPKNPVKIKKPELRMFVTMIDNSNVNISKEVEIKAYDKHIWIDSDKVVYGDIQNIDIQELSNKSSGSLGRALLGGALFGVAGAIVGGQSGKNKKVTILIIDYKDYKGNQKRVYLAPSKSNGKTMGDLVIYSIRNFLTTKLQNQHEEEPV